MQLELPAKSGPSRLGNHGPNPVVRNHIDCQVYALGFGLVHHFVRIAQAHVPALARLHGHQLLVEPELHAPEWQYFNTIESQSSRRTYLTPQGEPYAPGKGWDLWLGVFGLEAEEQIMRQEIAEVVEQAGSTVPVIAAPIASSTARCHNGQNARSTYENTRSINPLRDDSLQ